MPPSSIGEAMCSLHNATSLGNIAVISRPHLRQACRRCVVRTPARHTHQGFYIVIGACSLVLSPLPQNPTAPECEAVVEPGGVKMSDVASMTASWLLCVSPVPLLPRRRVGVGCRLWSATGTNVACLGGSEHGRCIPLRVSSVYWGDWS